MAEIDFQRRGTPLWVVLLILVALGAAGYFVFARRPADPAQQQAGPPLPPSAPGVPAQEAAPLPPPAGTSGPAAEFVRFVDARPFPASDAAAQRTYLVQTMGHLAAVVEQRAPTSGVQLTMLRAIADTIGMPATSLTRVTDLTQLAFFAFGHAMGETTPVGRALNEAASQVQLGASITTQSAAVRRYLRQVRDVLADPRTAGKRDTATVLPPTQLPPAPSRPVAPAGAPKAAAPTG